MGKKILGISAFYHDSAAALVIDGKLIAAAQEERFTRIKNTSDFPFNSIKYCLDKEMLEINDLDAIVFYDKPLLKFERLLQTYYTFAPKGLVSFLTAIPIWIKEKIFLKKLIYDELKKVGNYNKNNLKLLFTEHHLAHAASTFFSSSFDNAAILTIDAVGEWCTASIGIGIGNKIKILKELEFPHSVGLLYSSFTYYLGFKVNSGEYKLMGLAPYGNLNSEETKRFINIIKNKLIDIKEDGSIWLNLKYFSFATGLRMVDEKKWSELFGFLRRNFNEEIEQKHCNLALAIQKVTEEIVIKMSLTAKKITNSDNLCLAGGVALNCVSNGRLLEEKSFKNIYIQPAAGDAGGAIGAALSASFMYFNEARICNSYDDLMNGSYLGPEFSEKDIQYMNNENNTVSDKFNDYSQLTEFIAKKIAEGHVVGWFQGNMEFGPRALGNRSILADARNPEMQTVLNLKIKNREGFRPFAASVLEEDAPSFFDLEVSSPYMLIVSKLKEELRFLLPNNFQDFSLWEKLYYKRSNLQSITHVDYSTRVQTVNKKVNPKFWKLITEFKKQTGVGLLVNTSFNVRGEPIVCSPFDAYRCFMSTDISFLVIGNYVYNKIKQPNWEKRTIWAAKFNDD